MIPVYGPSVQVKILQFPMLAGYACTVHGSQGCSYRIVWIDMATFFAVAHAYVALSRARSLTIAVRHSLWTPTTCNCGIGFWQQMFWHPSPFNTFLLTRVEP